MHRPGDTASLLHQDDAYLQTGLTDEDTRRVWRAMTLAPTLEIAEALLRGEEVPRTALDPEWARRYGL